MNERESRQRQDRTDRPPAAKPPKKAGKRATGNDDTTTGRRTKPKPHDHGVPR